MLSRKDQTKIKLKLKNIYRHNLSEIEIGDCCKEITKLINKFNKKNQGIMGKVTDTIGNTVTKVVSATGNVATNTLKGTAKLAGQGVNVVKTSGKIFTNQSNRKSDI